MQPCCPHYKTWFCVNISHLKHLVRRLKYIKYSWFGRWLTIIRCCIKRKDGKYKCLNSEYNAYIILIYQKRVKYESTHSFKNIDAGGDNSSNTVKFLTWFDLSRKTQQNIFIQRYYPFLIRAKFEKIVGKSHKILRTFNGMVGFISNDWNHNNNYYFQFLSLRTMRQLGVAINSK